MTTMTQVKHIKQNAIPGPALISSATTARRGGFGIVGARDEYEGKTYEKSEQNRAGQHHAARLADVDGHVNRGHSCLARRADGSFARHRGRSTMNA